jgi:hypothetical protein
MPSTKSSRLLLIFAVVVCAFVGFGAWMRHSYYKAEEQYELQEEGRREAWLAQEKAAIAENERDYVYFYTTSGTDELLTEFSGMPDVAGLVFELTDLSDKGTQAIADIPNLKRLTLYGGRPRVGDTGLRFLAANTQIEILKLVNADVTDAGLKALASFPALRDLTLYRDGFRKNLLTDNAVNVLMQLEQLERLNICGGWMSDEAFAKLKGALPHCDVVSDEDW